MSIQLEQALDAMNAEGGYFRTRDGKIVGVGPQGYKASPGLKAKLLSLGSELEEYFAENNEAVRCFQCDKSDHCHDKTDCIFNRAGAGVPPGIGSPRSNFSSPSHRAQ